VALQGRLTRDPELRSTGSGIPVTSFSLAVNGKKDDTTFIDCVAWRGTAEAICQYLGKGRMMVVEGSLQSREWNDKEGNRRKSIEVNVSQFHFCDKKESAPPPVQNNEFQEIEDEEPGNLPF
jgi:single-strand DNA-binding protein